MHGRAAVAREAPDSGMCFSSRSALLIRPMPRIQPSCWTARWPVSGLGMVEMVSVANGVRRPWLGDSSQTHGPPRMRA